MKRDVNLLSNLFFCRTRSHCVVQSLASLVLIVCASNANAQGFVDNDGQPVFGNRAADHDVIPLDSLPKPPAKVARLIKNGKVRLITGGQAQLSPSAVPSGRRLMGETRFHINYQFKSESRWSQTASQRARGEVTIAVRFRKLDLTVDHDVWLKSPPRAEAFWDNSVVKHEFDHVRLSADPRIKQVFLDQTKPIKQFTVRLDQVADSRNRVDRTKVQQLVREKLRQAAQETKDFVQIRYQELDRITVHGMRPLPAESTLFDNVPE